MKGTVYSCIRCQETLDLRKAEISKGQIIAPCPKCKNKLELYTAECWAQTPIDFRKELGFPNNILDYIKKYFGKRKSCNNKPRYLFINESSSHHLLELHTYCEEHKYKEPFFTESSSIDTSVIVEPREIKKMGMGIKIFLLVSILVIILLIGGQLKKAEAPVKMMPVQSK